MLSLTERSFLFNGRCVNNESVCCSAAGVRTGGFPSSLPVEMATEGVVIGREVGSVESKKAR